MTRLSPTALAPSRSKQLGTGVCLLLALASPAALRAQETGGGPCAQPDSIVVRGNDRVNEQTVRADAGFAPGVALNFRVVQRAIKALYATGNYDAIALTCTVDDAGQHANLVLTVKERPVLGDVKVEGVKRVSERSVKDRVELLIGRPVDPLLVARAVTRIDSLYEAEGYYLARVQPETTMVDGRANLVFHIEEGRRLAISGIRILGNEKLSDGTVASSMKTKPEGFWWFRKGEFKDDKYQGDIAERIPELYARNGYVDVEVLKDTLIVDRERGKALVEITVKEGPQYKVGSFEIVGNRRFSTDELERYYPFTQVSPTLAQRVSGLVHRRAPASSLFDRTRWDEATDKISTAYRNEGFIYAQVRPVVNRDTTPSGQPVVNLRWELDERQPAIINRIDIAGNDYTTESCIRNSLVILPGDVFNQDRLVRSYQNIANMGFFETPMPPPDTRPNEQGDVDVVFRVKEKRTGNVNFGASMGQGTGVGGFIGLDQPNLFGQCKRGSLQWQFGQLINDFNLSYTDPSIQQGRLSGTISAYRTQQRFNISNLGRSVRTGGSFALGLPVPHSPFSRVQLSYGLEAIKFGTQGLFGQANDVYGDGNVRSTVGVNFTRDTRIDLPFATAGGMETFQAQFSGGPLGGSADFQRYTGEVRAYAPLGQLGGTSPGSQPVKFVLGLTARTGALFGNSGAFFGFQQFALGGVQFGEQLRGYPEFSISPSGYRATASTYNANIESFGNAFFSSTVEVGMRVNQMFYTDVFYDAGNIWRDPRQIFPTRLFRGAGFGVSVLTPVVGMLGIDVGYGFDRESVNIVTGKIRPDPSWQIHFRLGQMF